MKIISSKQIDDFFKRCLHNINSDTKNTFLDVFVTRKNEKYIKKEMEKAGYPPQTESLFLHVDEWLSTPYHRAIQLDHISDEHFTYETEWMAGNQLFNCDCIQKDPDRELNDYMVLKAMDKDFLCVFLLQDGKDWMMDAPSEAFTNDPIAEKSRGNVVTFGLGIGYYLFMACRNPKVTSITVVERSKEVIEMFQKYILPQFPAVKPIHFICDDAYNRWNKEFLDSFDTVYADIWQSNQDGLQCMTRLLELYVPPFASTHFWIEDSCMEILWTLSLLHFIEITKGIKQPVSPQYLPYMQKIRAYYANKDFTIETVEELKHLMYDTETLREILAMHNQ